MVTATRTQFPAGGVPNKKVGLLERTLRKLGLRQTTDDVDILADFGAYKPLVRGGRAGRVQLIKQTIQQLPASLKELAHSLSDNSIITENLSDFIGNSDVQQARARELGALFAKYGSDKSSDHNYHELYAHLLGDPSRRMNVMEIGLGTNNTDLASNMGANAKPGASLRAFRDYLDQSAIFGADVDHRVLFEEKRISTYCVDQTDRSSLRNLSNRLPSEFDLMIDDGLHAPNANIHSLEFFLQRIKIGGHAVIEDVSTASRTIWEVVHHLIPNRFSMHMVMTKKCLAIVVKREK